MLDLNTLRLVSAVSFACFALATVMLWRLVPQERGLRDWAAATILLSVGMLLMGLRGVIPSFISIVIANTLLTLGIGFLHVGTRNLLSFSSNSRWHWLAAVAAFFICLSPDVSVRVIGISMLYAPFLASSAWLFWRGKGARQIVVMQRITALIFVVGTVMVVIRILKPPSVSVPSIYLTTQSWAEIIPYLYTIMFSMWLSLTLLLMVSFRLQSQRAEALERAEMINRALIESETHLSTIIKSEPECIKVISAAGNLLEMNPAGLAMLEADSVDQLSGMKLLNTVIPKYREAFSDMHKRVLAGESVQMEFEVIGLKGGHRWLHSNAVPMQSKGNPVLLAVTRDITERKQVEKNLELSRFAIDKSTLPLYWVDPDGRIFDVNAEACKQLGYSYNELIGMHIWDFDPNYLPESRLEFWRMLKEQKTSTFESNHRRKDGAVFPVEITSNYISFEGQEFSISYAKNITVSKQAEAEILNYANYDQLTQLPNRRLFNDRLSQTLEWAKREQTRMALLFIDLDKFKPINDEHGHEAGDWVLEGVARRIESCLRASDTAARVGGDEFLVLLSNVKAGADALAVAEKIRVELERPFVTPSQLSLRASSSIGIAIYPDHANTEQDLMRLGDRAMYQAKRLGGNSVELSALSSEPEDTDDLRSAGQSIVRLTWKAAFACGQPTIDKEHRELFRLSNVLLGKMATRAGEPGQFDAAFDALLSHVVEHFAHEEAILLEHAYEHLQEHAKIHQALVAQALQLRHPANQEAGVSVGELVDFLVTEVVARHMLTEDRKFSALFADGARNSLGS